MGVGESNVPASSRKLVFLFRVLLLVVAAGAMATAVVLSQGRASVDPSVRYVCPMHAEVVAAEAGQCPICQMALEPVRANSTAGTGHDEMSDAADMRAVENLRRHDVIDFARTRSLLLDQQELRAPAWVETDGTIAAIFYNDQIEALAPDERGSFAPTHAPGRTVAVRRVSDSTTPWDRSTSQIRFRPNPPEKGRASPQPGWAGWVELARKPRHVLTVPSTAVLQSPEGPYVLMPTKGFELAKRRVEIGETIATTSVVLSGLRPHDRVVSRAAFFLDAERRQSTAPDVGGAQP
jgi:hypothetical protein